MVRAENQDFTLDSLLNVVSANLFNHLEFWRLLTPLSLPQLVLIRTGNSLLKALQVSLQCVANICFFSTLVGLSQELHDYRVFLNLVQRLFQDCLVHGAGFLRQRDRVESNSAVWQHGSPLFTFGARNTNRFCQYTVYVVTRGLSKDTVFGWILILECLRITKQTTVPQEGLIDDVRNACRVECTCCERDTWNVNQCLAHSVCTRAIVLEVMRFIQVGNVEL